MTLPRLQKFLADVIQRLGLDSPDYAFDALVADLTTYHEALIDYKSKKTPTIRLAFFPNNRSAYTKATLLTADLLFQRAQTAAATHDAPTLGAEFDPAKYAGFYATFKAGRDGTGAGDEQTAKARAEAQTHRQDLTLRLSDAVKLVAAQFPRDEARAAAYFRTGPAASPGRGQSRRQGCLMAA